MTNKNKYLFVGDSRMVGMAVSVHKVRHGKKLARKDGTNDAVGVGNDGNFYFASGATGIKFFENSVNAIAENAKKQDSDYIVIQMGANDWPNCTSHADADKLAKRYVKAAKEIEKASGKKVVLVSPYANNGAYETNRYTGHIPHQRDDLNKYMSYFNNALSEQAKASGLGYIDAYTWSLQYVGKKEYWSDGIHGSAKLSQALDTYLKGILDTWPSQTRENSQAQTINNVASNPVATPAVSSRRTVNHQRNQGAPTSQTNSASVTTNNPKIFKVGDSRTVGMYLAQHPRKKYSATVKDDGYYAKVGEGLNWMNKNIAEINKMSADSDVIVVSLGVNDIGNYKKYAEKMQELANGPWKGKQVYFTAVNPTMPGYKGYEEYNKKIATFNNYMKSHLPDNVHYIDTYSRFSSRSYQKNGQQVTEYYFDGKKVTSQDGLHYDNKTNKAVDEYITAAINNDYAQRVNVAEQTNINQTVATPAVQQPVVAEYSVNSSEYNNQGEQNPQGVMVTDAENAQKLGNQQVSDLNQSRGAADNVQETGSSALSTNRLTQMNKWARHLGFNEDDVNKLVEKYGDASYNIMLRAMMEPRYLMNDLGQGFRSSKSAIKYMLENDLNEQQTEQALSGVYGKGGRYWKDGSSTRGSVVTNNAENKSPAPAPQPEPAPAPQPEPAPAPQPEPTYGKELDEVVVVGQGNPAASKDNRLAGTADERYARMREWAPDFLVQFEGMKFGAYEDSGSPSIGLGTKQHWVNGKMVKTKYSDVISSDEAVLQCQQNLDLNYAYLLRHGVHVDKMSETQMMGIMSYMYNYGPGGIVNYPDKIRAINNYLDHPEDPAARNAARKCLIGKGGSRRNCEAALFLEDISPQDWANLPSKTFRSLKYTYDSKTGHYVELDGQIAKYKAGHSRAETAGQTVGDNREKRKTNEIEQFNSIRHRSRSQRRSNQANGANSSQRSTRRSGRAGGR